MSVTKLPRIFKYNEMVLDDPDIAMSPEAVKDFYAETYPELTQAEITGPETTDEGLVYELGKTVGTKGVVTLQDISTAGSAGNAEEDPQGTSFRLMNGLYHFICEKHSNEKPMLPPSSALGMI